MVEYYTFIKKNEQLLYVLMIKKDFQNAFLRKRR